MVTRICEKCWKHEPAETDPKDCGKVGCPHHNQRSWRESLLNILAVVPATFSRAITEEERCRGQAAALGLQEQFDLIRAYENERFRHLPGRPASSAEIIQTLVRIA